MVWKDHGNLGHKAWLKPEAVTPLRAWWFHQWARWVHVISPQVPSSTCKFRTLMTHIWYYTVQYWYWKLIRPWINKKVTALLNVFQHSIASNLRKEKIVWFLSHPTTWRWIPAIGVISASVTSGWQNGFHSRPSGSCWGGMGCLPRE